MKNLMKILVLGISLLGMFIGITMIEAQTDLFLQGTCLLALSFAGFCLVLYQAGLISLRHYLSTNLSQES